MNNCQNGGLGSFGCHLARANEHFPNGQVWNYTWNFTSRQDPDRDFRFGICRARVFDGPRVDARGVGRFEIETALCDMVSFPEPLFLVRHTYAVHPAARRAADRRRGRLGRHRPAGLREGAEADVPLDRPARRPALPLPDRLRARRLEALSRQRASVRHLVAAGLHKEDAAARPRASVPPPLRGREPNAPAERGDDGLRRHRPEALARRPRARPLGEEANAAPRFVAACNGAYCLQGPKDAAGNRTLSRNWELGRFASDGRNSPPHPALPAVGVGFHAWEGGAGYMDCLCASRAMPPFGTTYRAWACYSLGEGFVT